MNNTASARFDKQIRFIYKWLPIFCGCHRRPERSFFVKGIQMPVCARCEGELIGIIMGLIMVWFIRAPYWLMIAAMIPMVLDGSLQAFTGYESTNWRRLITGMMFGFGGTMILIMLGIAAFRYGVNVGVKLRA